MIQVENISVFCKFLKAVSMIVPDAKFVITEKKASAYVLKEKKLVRAFFETSSCVSTDGTQTFCLRELNKMLRALELIREVENKDQIELKYENGFITHSGKASIRFKTVKEDQIEDFVTEAIKSELVPEIEYVCSTNKLKRFLDSCSIVGDPKDAKVYQYVKDGEVYGEIGDKSNKYADNISLPISTKILTGTSLNPQTIKYENALHFITLPAEQIKVSFLPKFKMFLVESRIEEQGACEQSHFLEMKMLVRLSKG